MRTRLFSTALSTTAVLASGASAQFPPCLSSGCEPAPPGLVAWWPANGNPNDVVGSNHAILLGSTSYRPAICEGFNFGADGDGIIIHPSADLDANGVADLHELTTFTVEFWMNASVLQDGANSGCPGLGGCFLVVDKSHGGGDASGWFFQGAAGNRVLGTRYRKASLGFGIGLGCPCPPDDSNRVIGVTARFSMTDGSWHHVAGVFDGMSIQLYIDGLLVEAKALPPGSTYATNLRPINMGYWNHGSSGTTFPNAPQTMERFFRGAVDELSIYDRALDSNEILRIAQAGSCGKCPLPDCNSNNRPDECEPDCNGNGLPDECDLNNGTSQDTNGDGIPDECQA